VTGITYSINFPTANPFQPAYGGGGFPNSGDAFVTKFNPAGNILVYSTYLGGNDQDFGWGIAVDSSGYAYVTGATGSNNFPTANPRQYQILGEWDAFLTKFSLSGDTIVYSTYHGGTGTDGGYAIAVDFSGNAYVTGRTDSINFPTVNPHQPVIGGFFDAFITKFNPFGSDLVYSTYHGATGTEWTFAIAVDNFDNAYVTGATDSTNFPTANPFQPGNRGIGDAFITKIGDPTTFEITVNKLMYRTGDTIMAPEFRAKNSNPSPVPVHLKIWLGVPTMGEVVLVEIGADGSFNFPGNLNHNLGPVSLLTITDTFPPRGNWQWNSRIRNPATTAILYQDVNSFVVQ
jgi:hypothetical protein